MVDQFQIRAEHDLLFCVARRDLDEQRELDLRRLLSRPIEWNYLISTAREHGLMPLLYRHLNAIHSAIPAEQFHIIKQESVENCQSVLHLVGRLTKLLNTFNEQRIPVLVFKGPILAELAYGEKNLRQAGDLDVLIKRADFDRTKNLLEGLGYRMAPALTPSQQAAHVNFHCEIQFMRDNGFTVVDLHWSLTPKAFSVALDVDGMLERSQTVSIGGMKVSTFGLEDLILFQCVHGAKHSWSRLEWISSLAEVIRNAEFIDWEVLINRAGDARAVKVLALGLSLARQVGDAPIPQSIGARIDPTHSMEKFATAMLATMFKSGAKEYRTVRAIGRNLKIMDRKRDVLVSLLRAVFVPTISDWESLTLPQSVQWLYYVVRPLRLLKAYTVSLFRRVVFRKERRVDPIVRDAVGERLSGGIID